MCEWQPLAFPVSRTCLWDSTAVGDTVQVCVDGSRWILLSVSQSVLQLAIRTRRQTCSSPLHCLLLGSAFISEESMVIEVDRFDVGRTSKFCLQPTAVVPGDVIIHCTVDLEEAPPSSVSVAVAELRGTLQSSVGSVDPSHFLHLQLYLTAHLPDSISLLCHCVHPGSCNLTPVHEIPILRTALARNLAGPFSLPMLQETVRWGYLTMEVTRKLVLLLNSDPKSLCVPLVGVWVSGVSRVTHPVVWAAVLHYRHSCVLQERVGELCLCLVYTATQTHPSLFEFTNCGIEDQLFSCCTARRDLQVVCAGSPSFSVELLPSKLLSAELNVLPKDVADGGTADSPQGSSQRSVAPLPCPLPVLAKDSQLSCVSIMDKDRNNSCFSSSVVLSEDTAEQCLQTPMSTHLSPLSMTVFPKKAQPSRNTDDILEQQKQQLHTLQVQLSELLAVPKLPTAEIGTNTGKSLLQPSGLLETSEDTSAVPWETGVVTSTITNEANVVPEETSVATTLAGVSIAVDASLHTSGPISLDLCSFAPSGLEGGSTASEKKTFKESKSVSLVKEEKETDLLHNRHRFYEIMLAQVQELLQISDSNKHLMTVHATPLERPTLSSNEEISIHQTNKQADASIVPVPHILKSDSICESTLDEETNTADMIAMKYIDPPNSTTYDDSDVIPNQISIATQNYLHRHQLLDQEATPILDVKRLRTLPKLI